MEIVFLRLIHESDSGSLGLVPLACSVFLHVVGLLCNARFESIVLPVGSTRTEGTNEI